MPLPTFRYHPDPIATGSVKPSDRACSVCGEVRGFAYHGPVFSQRDEVGPLCPWCIANGRAQEALEAEFTDPDAIGDYGEGPEVPEAVRSEVAHRTPGFYGWQQERWPTCCDDATVFLGPMGHAELELQGPGAMAAIRAEFGGSELEWPRVFESLARDTEPTAYLFRCLHCGRFAGYSDCR